jgi:uncharacterized protein
MMNQAFRSGITHSDETLAHNLASRIRKPRIDLLVVQPTPFCNINCSYCYLPSRSVRDKIDDATLHALFAKVFSSGWVGKRLDVVWHAGEPTVLPVSFYRHAMAIMDQYRPANLPVTHNFQTNATLLNEDWCDLLRRPDMRMGVSIDGPQRLNDAKRLSRTGGSTFAKAMAGIRRLRDANIPFHVITVLSNDSLGSARELHDFYAAEGIEHVGFNVEESEGDHVSGLQAGQATCDRYKAFLAEFWAIASRAGTIKSIREINQMLGAVYSGPWPGPGSPRTGSNMLTDPFSILSMDHKGNLSTYSPELLGQTNVEYADFTIGNVHTHSFQEVLHSPVLARMDRDIQAGVAMCLAQCAYFHLCGGGEPVNKLAENGSFASTATQYCRMTRMAVADLMIEGPYAA